MPENAGVPTGELHRQTRARFGRNHGLSSRSAESGLNDFRELQKWSRVNNAARDTERSLAKRPFL